MYEGQCPFHVHLCLALCRETVDAMMRISGGGRMRVVILMESMKEEGNTAHQVEPFREELQSLGTEVKTVTLADKNIAPCRGCMTCQKVTDSYGCAQKDDMQAVFDDLVWADAVILATPVYTWYCTPPMKAVLDRTFGMNKYYGPVTGKSFWKGKAIGIITSCGYEIPYGTSPLKDGIRRLCEHSGIPFLGMFAVRDENGTRDFKTPEAQEGAKAFARKIVKAVKKQNLV